MSQSLRVFISRPTSAVALAIAILAWSSSLHAAVLYSEDFEGETLGSIGFGQSTSNLPPFLVSREISPTGGVGGSAALRYAFDGTGRTNDFQIGVFLGIPIPASDSAPLGGLSSLTPSQVRFSIDLKSAGGTPVTPIRLGVYQNDPNYEADRSIDRNGDGDMVDSATVYRSIYRQTFVDGADYVTASFTLDQGEIGASMLTIPIDPEFDATVPLAFSIQFRSEDYGFDGDNVLYFDNIRIDLIPEPSALALAAIGLAGVATLRRRQRLEGKQSL